MGFIKFDKNQLINLEYALDREMLRSNRAGSFSCTTIIGCNTRKYHGLLVCPQPNLGNETHVLLSKLDETVIQHQTEFNIGISRYPGTFSPKGHKYVRDFSADIIPCLTYRVGGVLLTKETMFISEEERILIRYTLVEAKSPTTIRIKPFLAFRNIHSLSKRNIYLDTKYQPVDQGIQVRMYQGYSPLFMQVSKKAAEYYHAPDWYNDIEYPEEKERGYDCHEDLYLPGFFEFPIKKGESVIFCAGTKEVLPQQLSRYFSSELKARTPRNSFENCLINSAEQFFFRHREGIDVIAGYPWYDRIGRFTFIALPGLSLATHNRKSCHQVLESMVSQMSGPFFPEEGRGPNTSYLSADTSLWFIWALQQCSCDDKEKLKLWSKYGKVVVHILESYAAGAAFIKMQDNGLLHISKEFGDTTWMNARIEGKPVTPRYGLVVELNALWYNALMYACEMNIKSGKTEFAHKWKAILDSFPEAFEETFWNHENRCLADYVYHGRQNQQVRPNQVLAVSMPYSPLKESTAKKVLDRVIKELLTPKGLRSLSPKDPDYRGRYFGHAQQRDRAFHQGCVWPWLIGHFSEAFLKLYKSNGVEYIRRLYENFYEDMQDAGVGSISEIYEGDPPHSSRGAISFAASVAELLRMQKLMDDYRDK